MSNAPIAASAQRPSKLLAMGKPTISKPRNKRKRGGAILLPMVGGFVMTRERNESGPRVQ